MPYSVKKRGEQWCVVKDSDGSSIGYHGTEAEANAQLTAVNLSENFAVPQKYEHINFTPPDGARTAAQRALDWIADGKAGSGFTDTGRARAADLARSGYKPSPEVVRRMKAFFDRHQSNKSAEGFNSGEDGYPSPGRVAWDAWGGDAGYAFARRVVEQMEAADKDNMRLIDKYGVVDGDWIRILPMGVFERFGRTVKVTADMIREMARNFGNVPDTTIAVNAEHDGTKGKVADVTAVEARGDGLWARLGNWIDGAAEVASSGAFQYVSPEIVWGPTNYDGREVSNVLVGLALTNLPFFGKETALYRIDGGIMDDEYMEQSANSNIVGMLLDALLKLMGMKQQPMSEEAEDMGGGGEEYRAVDAKLEERFSVLETENAALREKAEKLAADAEAMRLDAERKQRLQQYNAIGALHDDLPGVLADMQDQDKAAEIIQAFDALTVQQEFAALFAELGRDGGGEANNDPVKVFEAAIAEKQKEMGLPYADAVSAVTQESPELYQAYIAGLKPAKE